MDTVDFKKEHSVKNTIFNLYTGLKPQDLTNAEIDELRRVIGRDWFFKLGFKLETHARPEYDINLDTQEDTVL